jgi:long-chain acyl-CoA synthetase
LEAFQNRSTIVSRVGDHARQAPGRVAVNFAADKLTFADIDQSSDQVASGLAAAGVRAGSRIAILAKNTPVFYELLLGAAKIGAVLVPINYRLAPAEIAFILGDANVELLFSETEYAEALAQVGGEASDLRDILWIDVGDPGVASLSSWRAGHAPLDLNLEIDPAAVVVQMYTSGTTGRPKGTLLTHANLRESLRVGIPAWGPWRDEDMILVCMPQYHIGASIWGLAGLWQGAGSVLTRDFNPAEALAIIEQQRVTKTQLASVMMKMLLDDPLCPTTDFSSLELIVYGAAPAPLSLVRSAQERFGCGIAQGYGMTETAGAITYLSAEDHAHPVGERLRSAGRALEGVEVEVVDPNGVTLPIGTTGEVVCRGGQVTLGYWKLPEASAEAIRDGWLRTGDAGYLDADGYLYICDRVKDMIVSGGENIYPAEVENALYAHPAVKDAAVIGVPDGRWGEVAKAIVVLAPGTHPTKDELIEFVRGRIARFKAPRSVEFVDALPRNASGKILKRELRRPYWEARASAVI